MIIDGALLTTALFSSSLEHVFPIDGFRAVFRVASMGASTSCTFDVVGADVALPFRRFVGRAFRIFLEMARLTTFAAASVKDTLGSMVPIPVAVATLPCAEITEDVARVFPYSDFNRTFWDATTRVDDSSNIFLTCGCNFDVAGRAASVVRIRCPGHSYY